MCDICRMCVYEKNGHNYVWIMCIVTKCEIIRKDTVSQFGREDFLDWIKFSSIRTQTQMNIEGSLWRSFFGSLGSKFLLQCLIAFNINWCTTWCNFISKIIFQLKMQQTTEFSTPDTQHSSAWCTFYCVCIHLKVNIMLSVYCTSAHIKILYLLLI